MCTSASVAATTSVNGEITVPSEVQNSGGTYNNKYAGVASATGTMTSSTTPTTANTTYYAVYRTEITMYYPSSASAATNKKVYQNQWFTSTSAMATTILGTSTTSTTNNGSYGTLVSGYSLAGFATSASTNTVTYANIAALTEMDSGRNATKTVYQVDKKDASVTATFYYQSNAESGSTTVATKTASGTQTTYLRCTSTTAAATNISNGSITIPSEVTSSGGTYNNKFAGVATTTGTMTSSTEATTANTTYYSVYRTNVKIYYPSSTSAVTSKDTYQNQWFTSTSALAETVLSTSSTGTSTNATAGTVVSGYTFGGFSAYMDDIDEYDYADVSALRTMNSQGDTVRNVYQIDTKSETRTATFYYQSNATAGSTTISNTSASQSVMGWLWCQTTSAANSYFETATVEIPSAVINSGGTYNNDYAGLRTSAGASMSPNVAKTETSVSLTANTTYYAIYSTEITIYYPTSTSAVTSKKVYQNQWFTSASAMATTVLSSSSTGTTTNATAGALVSGYSLVGFATSPSVDTPSTNSSNTAMTTIATLAQINSDGHATEDVYQITKKDESVTAVFYYSSSNTGAKTNSSASGITTRYLRPTDETTAEVNTIYGTINAQSQASSAQANVPYGTTFVGWATNASDMSTVSNVTSANTTYYAVYRSNVTNYYYSGSWKTRTLYRNGYYGTATKYTMVLSTDQEETTMVTNASSGPTGFIFEDVLVGYNNTDDPEDELSYSGAASADYTYIFEHYWSKINYAKGANVSAIGATSRSCYLDYLGFDGTATTCTVTLPTITPNSGFLSVGWSATNGDTSGQAAGTSYTITTHNQTLYANAQVLNGPTANITTTSTLKAASQTATLTCSDSNGVVGYYWGTNANVTSNTYTTITSTTNMSVTKTVSSAGTYYLACKNSYDRLTDPVVSKTYHSYTVNNMLQKVSGSTYTTTDYAQASTGTYIAPKNTTITLTSVYTIPGHSRSGRFVGASTGAASTTAATPSKTNQIGRASCRERV